MLPKLELAMSSLLALLGSGGLFVTLFSQVAIGPSGDNLTNLGLLGLAILGGLALHRLLMVAQESKYKALELTTQRELKTHADTHAEVLKAKEEAAAYLRHRIDAYEKELDAANERNRRLMETLASDKAAMVQLQTGMIEANKEAISAFGAELTVTRQSVHDLAGKMTSGMGRLELAIHHLEVVAHTEPSMPTHDHSMAQANQEVHP